MELKSQIPFEIRDSRSSKSKNNFIKTRKSMEKINWNEFSWMYDRVLCICSQLRTFKECNIE